jgi:hypothetical protein
MQCIVLVFKNCEMEEWQKIARSVLLVGGHNSLISNCQD